MFVILQTMNNIINITCAQGALYGLATRVTYTTSNDVSFDTPRLGY